MVNPAGTWTYDYDGNQHLTSLSSPAGSFSANYFSNRWPENRTLPDGAETTYSWNARGFLTGLTTKTSSNSVLSQYGSFTYDGAISLTGLSATVTGVTTQSGHTTWGYDSLNRTNLQSSARLGGYSETFNCDAADDPTTFKGNTVAFNNDDQVTASGFTFDGSGEPTSYKGSACTFDPGHRLLTVGSNWSASYRSDGLRASKTTSSGSTYYLYDRGEPVVELNSSGAVTGVNVFAPDGLVARQQSGSWINYTFDQQGNVAQRLNASQGVLSSSIYDAFGTESSSGTPTDPFGYNARSGYYLDRENALYLCRQRYYDPSYGRWLTRDPIGYENGVDVYSYARQRGERFDASGLYLSSLDTPSGAAEAVDDYAIINGTDGAGGGGGGYGSVLPTVGAIGAGLGGAAGLLLSPPPCPPPSASPVAPSPIAPSRVGGAPNPPPGWDFGDDDPFSSGYDPDLNSPVPPDKQPPDDGGDDGDDGDDGDPLCNNLAAQASMASFIANGPPDDVSGFKKCLTQQCNAAGAAAFEQNMWDYIGKCFTDFG